MIPEIDNLENTMRCWVLWGGLSSGFSIHRNPGRAQKLLASYYYYTSIPYEVEEEGKNARIHADFPGNTRNPSGNMISRKFIFILLPQNLGKKIHALIYFINKSCALIIPYH